MLSGKANGAEALAKLEGELKQIKRAEAGERDRRDGALRRGRPLEQAGSRPAGEAVRAARPMSSTGSGATAWLFLAPMLVVLVLVAGWPLLRTIWFTFTDANLTDLDASTLRRLRQLPRRLRG